jgi:hypothetical protein
VLLYPRNASSELKEAHSALSRELNARSYRVLPEHEFDPAPDVRRCDLVVLLLGAGYDENAERLIDAATELRKRFLVWPSPALERRGELAQVGFLEAIRKSESAGKILLSPEITPEKLKQEVFAVLDPRATISPAPDGKPRVYLIYDSRQPGEKNHAAEIAYAYRNEFHFDGSENPRQHTVSLTHSDGVLLVWGKADENWFAWEFDQMFRLSQRPKARGLCLFDPQESKIALAEKIRSADSAIHVAEAFGRLDPSRLEPFFEPIRRGAA